MLRCWKKFNISQLVSFWKRMIEIDISNITKLENSSWWIKNGRINFLFELEAEAAIIITNLKNSVY